jgi:hypothetical protein
MRTKPNEIEIEVDAIKSILETLMSLREEQRKFVITTVLARLGMEGLPTSRERLNSGDSSGATKTDEDISPKDFLRKKQPTTTIEQLTCLAYYLSKFRGVKHFKTADITKLNTEAGAHKLSNPSVFVRNATSQNGYLIQVGGGKKQLSELGESIVDALPDREKVVAELSRIRPGTKKKKSKNKK